MTLSLGGGRAEYGISILSLLEDFVSEGTLLFNKYKFVS